MSDDEREAHIREGVHTMAVDFHLHRYDDWRLLLSRLDEARAASNRAHAALSETAQRLTVVAGERDAARLALSGAEADRDRLREEVARLCTELADWTGDKPTSCRLDPSGGCATILACHMVCQRFAGHEELSPLRAPPSADVTHAGELWRDLCEKDDRTSPEEYPDMALITEDEFVSALSQHGSSEYARAIGEAAQVANAVAHRAADNAGRIKEANPGLTLDKLREIDHQLAGQRHAAVEIEQGIRALSSKPASDDAVYRR